MWLWTGLPWSWALALAGVVGGTLVLVHLLRPRPRRLKVITTMFWQEAGLTVHGGRLGGRPSQWLSLLLLLTALLLGTLALRSPLWMSADVRPVVLVIDNGLPSGATESFEQTVRELVASNKDAVALIAAAPLPRILQAPGQADGRGLHRLSELSSNTAAATGPSLQLAGALSKATDGADIIVVTVTAERWRDAADALDMSGDVRIIEVAEPQSNTAVIGVTWRSDRPLSVRGELAVRVGAWLREAGDVRLSLIDTRVGSEPSQRTVARSAGSSRMTERFDIAAQGQVLRILVEGPEDSLAADNEMQLTLPVRRRVLARPGPDAPMALLAALESAGCDVEEMSTPLSSGLIELYLEDDDGPSRAGLIQVVANSAGNAPNPVWSVAHGTGWAGDIDFEGVRLPRNSGNGLSPDPEDEPIVMVGDHAVAWLAWEPGGVPRIVLDEGWFDSQAMAAASGGFAVMLSRAVARIVQLDPEPVTASAQRRHDDLPWLRQQTDADVMAWLAAPGSPSVSNLLRTTDAAATVVNEATGWHVRWRSVLAGLSAGLIFLSWWLFERGRIA